jgi:hypothetical protein
MSAYVNRRVCSLQIHHERYDLGSQEPVDLVQSQLAAIIEHLQREDRVRLGMVVLMQRAPSIQSKLESERRQRKTRQSSRMTIKCNKYSIQEGGLQNVAGAGELRRR